MKLTSQDLRLQAWLLILFLCGMFVGGLELLTNIFPIMRLPESIRLSAEGAIAVLAGSGAMTAIFFKKPQWRLIFGLTLLGLAGYTLGHNWLADNEDSGLSLLTGQLRLENPPAIIVLILSGVALLGLTSPLGRLFGFLSGSTGIAVGGYTVSAHLQQRVVGERSEEHTSELQSRPHLVCRLLLEKKKITEAISSPPPKCATLQCAWY